MKKAIIFFDIMLIFIVSCRPTLNVTETSTKQIEEKLIDYQKEDSIGAEVTLLLINGEEISGELLSVRDSSIALCATYSATEEELASLKHPISIIETDGIREFEIAGNTFPRWIGAGIGFVAGTTAGILVINDLKETSTEESIDKALGSCCLVAGLTTLPVVIGRLLSTEDVILSDIPSGYKFLPLKSLARYPDEEPVYLKAIN